MGLSDLENCALGLVCGTADVTLLQSTNYWKNAAQNGMPFTLDPRILYRGYFANALNNGFCVMSQFYLNGVIKKSITGGVDRPLGDGEKIAAGAAAGALSGTVCGPIELVMIQQQKKGGGLFSTAVEMVKAGPSTFFRGTSAMMAREGIYAGFFLGGMPVTREWVQRTFPDSLGKTEDSARLAAAVIAGPVCTFTSHPPDTIKSCMQGDIEGAKYKGYGQTVNTLVTERGVASLWAGMPWRIFRQMIALMLIDKINSTVAPMMFPHAFEPKRG